MRIYAAISVFIEVTRRCNMCCAHCLRGDAENIDIQEKYMSFPAAIGPTSRRRNIVLVM